MDSLQTEKSFRTQKCPPIAYPLTPSEVKRFFKYVTYDAFGVPWWTGGVASRGAGQFSLRGRMVNPAIVYWMLQNTTDWPGGVPRHVPSDSAYLRLDSVVPGTYAENARDQHTVAHEPDWRLGADGGYKCRVCERIVDAASRARQIRLRDQALGVSA